MNLFDSDICWVYITDDGLRRRILFCTDDERDAPSTTPSTPWPTS